VRGAADAFGSAADLLGAGASKRGLSAEGRVASIAIGGDDRIRIPAAASPKRK
jgi:hypothetical protein